jgi:hypothetical protein
VALDLRARPDVADFERQGFVFQGLAPADVRWTCERLNVLTDQQWRDVFRAAHYDETDRRAVHHEAQGESADRFEAAMMRRP